jgi:hypothetical protein
MPNLTSTLTLKLTDDVSAPAGKIAASLKGLGVSAKQLDAAHLLDTAGLPLFSPRPSEV